MATPTVAIPAKSDEPASFSEIARIWEKDEYYPLKRELLEKSILEQRVEGRIGRYTASSLDEALADPETMWAEKEIYDAREVWGTLDAIRWWLENLYDIFSTRSAMALADPAKGIAHPLQAVLLDEASSLFALSLAAIQEQTCSGYMLFVGDVGDVDLNFPRTVDLMRRYRIFAKRAAATCVTIFPDLAGTIEDVI